MRIRRMFFILCGFLCFALATTDTTYGQVFYDSGRVPGWIPQHDTIYVSNGYLIRTYSPDFVVEDELVVFDNSKFQIDFYRLVWSPDGERFVVNVNAYDIDADEYVTITQLWSWATKSKIADLTPTYGAELVAWNGDGSQIAVTYYESPANDRIHIYNGHTGQAIKSLMATVSSNISFMFWNPDVTRNELAVFVQNAQTFNGGLVIWDTVSDQFLQQITTHPAYALFNESGDEIAFIDYDNSSTVQIWSTETWQSVMALTGYDIRAAIFSWKNETLSVFGADGNTRLWDTSSGEILLEVELGTLQNAPLLNATATNMLVIGRGGRYRYDTVTGQLLSSMGIMPTLSEIQVYNADNGSYITNIQNDSVIDLQSIGTPNLIFQGNFTNVEEIWRVKFQINESLENSDDSVPYQSMQWQAEVGTHTLSITPFIGDRISNAAGYQMVVDFTVVDNAIQTCDYDIAASDTTALIQAINDAKANPGAAVICLANSTYAFTSVAEWSQGPNALPNITDEITIIGNGATLTRDSSLPDARVARVASGGTLTVENVIFDNWDTYDSGGVFYVEGTLSLTDSTLRNSSGEQGGALYSTAGGTLTVADSTFESNSTSYERGGAIYNRGSLDIPK